MASFGAGLGSLCHGASIVLLMDVVLDSKTWNLDLCGEGLIAGLPEHLKYRYS
jgi:hypothetical protein